jgi:hypothetical protein
MGDGQPIWNDIDPCAVRFFNIDSTHTCATDESICEDVCTYPPGDPLFSKDCHTYDDSTIEGYARDAFGQISTKDDPALLDAFKTKFRNWFKYNCQGPCAGSNCPTYDADRKTWASSFPSVRRYPTMNANGNVSRIIVQDNSDQSRRIYETFTAPSGCYPCQQSMNVATSPSEMNHPDYEFVNSNYGTCRTHEKDNLSKPTDGKCPNPRPTCQCVMLPNPQTNAGCDVKYDVDASEYVAACNYAADPSVGKPCEQWYAIQKDDLIHSLARDMGQTDNEQALSFYESKMDSYVDQACSNVCKDPSGNSTACTPTSSQITNWAKRTFPVSKYPKFDSSGNFVSYQNASSDDKAAGKQQWLDFYSANSFPCHESLSIQTDVMGTTSPYVIENPNYTACEDALYAEAKNPILNMCPDTRSYYDWYTQQVVVVDPAPYLRQCQDALIDDTVPDSHGYCPYNKTDAVGNAYKVPQDVHNKCTCDARYVPGHDGTNPYTGASQEREAWLKPMLNGSCPYVRYNAIGQAISVTDEDRATCMTNCRYVPGNDGVDPDYVPPDDDDDDDDKKNKQRNIAIASLVTLGLLGVATIVGASVWYYTKGKKQ